MLQNKDIKNLSELKLSLTDEHKKLEFFLEFIDILKLGKLQAVFSGIKQKGISSLHLIRLLIVFPFIDQSSVYGFTKSYWQKFAGYGKDAYYRLKNNSKINWRSFHFGVVKLLLKTVKTREFNCECSKRGPTAFILDDTLLAKEGKAIEGVSRIWDHVIHKAVLGFQLLVMGYYDGTMFLPINFSIHRSKGKNKKFPYGLKPKHYRKQYKKKRDVKTPGYKRKKELDENKIKSAVSMIKSAVKQNIIADYILADSWFTCHELVMTALENKIHFIGMFSKVKTLFTYRNKQLTFRKIRHLNRKKIKRNRRFKLYYIHTVVEWKGQRIVLLFTRKGKKGKWKCIVNTNLSLSVTKIFEIYQIRWTIEVFFKESKQYLSLGKAQSNDFDAQIADTTIIMVQYLFLALKNRVEKYETIGKLFRKTKEDLIELRLHQRLIALLITVIEIISTFFDDADEELIIYKAINNDENLNKLLYLMNIQNDEYEKAA